MYTKMNIRRMNHQARIGLFALAYTFIPLNLFAQTISRAPTDHTLNTEDSNVQADVVLQVAEQHVLSADGVKSYSEGKRGVVDVRLTRAGDQFVLVGQRAGKTTLLLMMDDGKQRHITIEVIDPERPEPKEKGVLSVEEQDNVRLDFYFVQLMRSDDLQIGLGYPQSVSLGSFSAGFDFLTQRFESATAVVQDQALLRLDMAQSGGWAKLMRKAAVITENGQKTTFSGGGEVNIPVIGQLTGGIYSIEFGSMIEVLPRYDAQSGRMQIALRADVSDLADDRGTGAPGRVVSTLDTIVNLELGQAVVLAGLSSENQLKSRSGVPVLSQIPILGWLFGSEKSGHQAFDNVILIVPTVVDATSQDARSRVTDAFDAYKSYHGKDAVRSKLRQTWEKP